MALQLPIGHHNEEETPAYSKVPAGSLSPVNSPTPTARNLQKDGDAPKARGCLAKTLIGLGSGLIVGAVVAGGLYYEATQSPGLNFVRVKKGSCVSNGFKPIKDPATCGKAIKALLLPVGEMELVPRESMDGLDRSLAFDVPEDCYFLSVAMDPPRHTLFFNQGFPGGEATTASVQGSVTREPICLQPELPTTPEKSKKAPDEQLATAKTTKAPEAEKGEEASEDETKTTNKPKTQEDGDQDKKVIDKKKASEATAENSKPKSATVKESVEETGRHKAALRGSHDEDEPEEEKSVSSPSSKHAKAKQHEGKKTHPAVSEEDKEEKGEDHDAVQAQAAHDETEDKDLATRAESEKEWLDMSK